MSKNIRFCSILLLGLLIVNQAFTQKSDSTRIPKIQTYQLTSNFEYKSIPLDTNLRLFQIFNPVEKNCISNSFLGNYGLANMHNIIVDQPGFYWEDFFFSKYFHDYFQLPENQIFYNTNAPYTQIYWTASRKNKDEQTLQALHTQNINQKQNIGVKFNLVLSKGRLLNQKSKDNALSAWYNYNGLQYSLRTSIFFNKAKVEENGGIVDTGKVNFSEVKVNLLKAKNLLYNRTFILNQEYKFGKKLVEFINDTTKKEVFIPKSIINHSFSYTKNYRVYSDNEPNKDFYPRFIFDTLQTADSALHYNLKNTFHYKLLPTKNRNFFTNIAVNHEYKKYYNLKNYILLSGESNFSDISLYGGIDNLNLSKWYWDISANYYISGERQKDYKVQGLISRNFKLSTDSLSISLSGVTEQREPGHFIKSYTSNHYKWDNDFKKQLRSDAKISFTMPSQLFEFSITYSLFDNYIYFDTASVLQQNNSKINLITGKISKDIKIWKFHLINIIVYQKTNNEDILHIPELSFYHSTYFEFVLLKQALQSQIGFDIYYSLKYESPLYNPALAQFYLSKDDMVGNYPIMSIFLNARIRTALIFLKLEHANAGLQQDYYYHVKHYPINDLYFKFGVSWRFFN